MMIAIITIFFAASFPPAISGLASALILTSAILIGIMMTFAVSWALSKTILKGVPSSFTLELPPFRPPQVGSIIVRSIFDRTLFVLGRAVAVAAPAGMIIWLFANVHIGGASLLTHLSGALDPIGRLMGLDGIILTGFLLGFPANEIVIPIIIMAYMATGTLTEYESLAQLQALLVQNGWTWTTAVSALLFSLMHWPCSTTCMTIKKETGSSKWTLLSFAIPAVCGFAFCTAFNALAQLITQLI